MNGPESESVRYPDIEGQAPPHGTRDDLFSFYETVLHISASMARLEERSESQGRKLAKIEEILEKTDKEIIRAKASLQVAFWIISTIFVGAVGFIVWLVNILVKIIPVG